MTTGTNTRRSRALVELPTRYLTGTARALRRPEGKAR